MKKYETPNIVITEFTSQDIITLSNYSTNESIPKVQTTFNTIDF